MFHDLSGSHSNDGHHNGEEQRKTRGRHDEHLIGQDANEKDGSMWERTPLAVHEKSAWRNSLSLGGSQKKPQRMALVSHLFCFSFSETHLSATPI